MDRIVQYSSDTSSDESDFEFELNFRPRSAMSVLDDEVRVRLPPRVFDSEYYDLPPIENISLNDKPIVKPLGFVANIIDFVVTIKAGANTPLLDFDTVLFNSDADVLGTVFDIFGQFSEPMYAIRFNNAEETQKCHCGMAVMYAPENFELTHIAFANLSVSKNKVCDDGGQDPDFSDDEAEREYMQQKKAKTRTPSQSSSVPPVKRNKPSVQH